MTPQFHADPNDEKQVATLLKSAGERSLPRPEATQRAHELALGAWQSMLASQRNSRRAHRRQVLIWAGAAASIAAVMIVAGRLAFMPPAMIAEVERVEGSVEAMLPQLRLLMRKTQLAEGTEIATAEGRAALRMDGLSLRVDEHTRLRLNERGRITLERGILYVDTGLARASPHRALSISTPAGEVSHSGTQFQVQVDETSTRVGVREGDVRLERAVTRDGSVVRRAIISVAAGEEVRVTSEGLVARRAIATFGADWDWVTDIAPTMDIENRSAAEFLVWLAREQGWQLRFSTPAVRDAAATTMLHGSIAGLSLDGTLARVAAITSFSLTVKDGILLVEFERAAS